MPLRLRLTLGYSLFFAAILLLMTVGVYLLVRNALLTEVQRELGVNAELIQRDFAASQAPLGSYFASPAAALQALPPRVEGLESPSLYVQVLAADGAIVVTSASLGSWTLPAEPMLLTAALRGELDERIVDLGNGRAFMRTERLAHDGTAIGVLQVAQPLRAVDLTLRVLLIGLAATGLIALVAAARGGAWIARRALRPVEEIAQTTQQIVYAADLQRRVPDAPADDELGHLTTTINAMLARLDQLFTAQRRFVTDVSHELRTPLTAMRGHLELMQRGVTRDGAAQAESVNDMLREVARLTRMANDLLLLAQAEVGLQVRCAPVALDEVVLEVVRELRPLAAGVALRPELQTQITVLGDRDRLKQALLNLVANGLQHTPPGGCVTVGLEHDQHGVTLFVRDTGAGIAPDDLPSVFERFYRADRSRAQRAGGAGLGLAIVQWVAEAHKGTVAVASSPGHGATFTIVLPSPTAEHGLHATLSSAGSREQDSEVES
jgi:signal transduction histidine kinase